MRCACMYFTWIIRRLRTLAAEVRTGHPHESRLDLIDFGEHARERVDIPYASNPHGVRVSKNRNLTLTISNHYR